MINWNIRCCINFIVQLCISYLKSNKSLWHRSPGSLEIHSWIYVYFYWHIGTFYVHGTVHLSNTSFIKYQRDATFSVYLVFYKNHFFLFIWFFIKTKFFSVYLVFYKNHFSVYLVYYKNQIFSVYLVFYKNQIFPFIWFFIKTNLFCLFGFL